MRGYFGIGIEGASKPMNAGALFRTAHAFGASFVFTIDAHYKVSDNRSDTSKALGHMPYYEWADAAAMDLPFDCKIVAIELLDEAVELPSFAHPQRACYVLGRERGAVSRELIERADHVIRIPTKFCINVGLAGAIVMYDRMINMRRFAARPLMEGQRPEALTEPFFGSHTPRSAKD